MKQRYSLLSLAVITACYSNYATADLQQQCLLGVPHFQGEEIKGEQTQMPVTIEADSAVINQPKDATYTGNVSVQQGNRLIIADQVRVEQEGEERRAYLQGSFNYQDNLIQATGSNANVNLLSKDANLSNTEYQLVGRQGRGQAESGEFGENKRILRNASFTSCLPNDNSWEIEANEMIQHVNEEYAEMWHARFKVLGTPVFYSPYLQFPIGDRRRSGLLIPSFERSSKNGWTYSQPFYWNIAPNMDATLTPTYYSRRGWQLSPEFRYLTKLGQGLIATEYMSKDRLDEYQPDDNDRKRYLLHWRHSMSFLTDWRLNVNYTKVSDKRYFSDFDSEYGSSTDGYATQSFKLGYYQPKYNLSVSGKKFQTFDDLDIGPYRVLPQVDFNYYQNNLFNERADFHFFAQAARFENDSKLMPKAWRFHAEPSLNVPLTSRYGSLNFETKLYATHYIQNKGSSSQAEDIKKNVSRVIPQVKLDFTTILETDKPMFKGVTQTFEPRVQYIYRPYRNQSDIGSKLHQSVALGYDSSLLQSDYFSLFNDRRYSGLDRIASANLVTAGGTTRFFNEKTGAEVFNLSLGQTYYLTPSRIDENQANSTDRRSSSWAAESNWKFHRKWNWHGSYQYDTRLNETSLANMSLQYKPSKDKLIQLNYRYASENYINQNLSTNRYNQDIKQVGAILGWELTDNIAIMTSHYQDVALKKTVESQFSVNYNTCCWSANVYVARKLKATPTGSSDTINDFYYDNKFGINFELRFGTNYSSGVSKMLKKGLIPYSEPYGIN